tara:strand:+ start:581 stop:1051 length:471 start_codon:yes stop_codon:yes gene_type:complete
VQQQIDILKEPERKARTLDAIYTYDEYRNRNQNMTSQQREDELTRKMRSSKLLKGIVSNKDMPSSDGEEDDELLTTFNLQTKKHESWMMFNPSSQEDTVFRSWLLGLLTFTCHENEDGDANLEIQEIFRDSLQEMEFYHQDFVRKYLNLREKVARK